MGRDEVAPLRPNMRPLVLALLVCGLGAPSEGLTMGGSNETSAVAHVEALRHEIEDLAAHVSNHVFGDLTDVNKSSAIQEDGRQSAKNQIDMIKKLLLFHTDAIETLDLVFTLALVMIVIQPETSHSFMRKAMKDENAGIIDIDKLPPALARWKEWDAVTFDHSYHGAHTLPKWKFVDKFVTHCEKLRLPIESRMTHEVYEILNAQAVKRFEEEKDDNRTFPYELSFGQVKISSDRTVYRPRKAEMGEDENTIKRRSQTAIVNRLWRDRALALALVLNIISTVVDTLPYNN